MLKAFVWGLIATSSLVIGGLIGAHWKLGRGPPKIHQRIAWLESDRAHDPGYTFGRRSRIACHRAGNTGSRCGQSCHADSRFYFESPRSHCRHIRHGVWRMAKATHPEVVALDV